ncbi:MAG: 7-carboxy-7-deazaguanine synthase QueE, partial [Myxococcota bacterium]
DAILALACPHVIFTGGEPMVQQTKLLEVAASFRARVDGATVDLETNGTIAPKPEFDALVDHYVVSPKLSSAGMTEGKRIREQALRFFAECGRSSFKFVVSTDEDLREILGLIDTGGLPRERVYLMPEGQTLEGLQRNQERVARLCLEHGFRFSDRLHVRLYGAKRGV